MNIIKLKSVGSTSTYLREEMPDAPHGTVIATDCQTAGRGQRGNSWEAEPGRNLTFSIMLRPAGVDASTQYAVSEAVATAITDVLQPLVPDSGMLAIKWPNDIYYGNRKLGGILIESTLTGKTVAKCIAGAGININQRQFVSNAPNPVSLWQITNREHDLGTLLEAIADAIIAKVGMLGTPGGREAVAAEYFSRLWRRNGFHPYRLPDGTCFEAAIHRIEPTGHLTLLHSDGTVSTHAFKEVSVVLDNDLTLN